MADRAVRICQIIAAAIKADGPLNAFCSLWFGGVLTLHVGIDKNNPPGDADLPVVALIPQSSGIINEDDHRENPIVIGVAIRKDTSTTSESPEVITFDGLDLLDQIVELIWQAMVPFTMASLAQQDRDCLSVGSWRYEMEHPYYHATREITIITEK